MPGQKISSLTPVSELQAVDQFPLSRGGTTYKITGDKLASSTQVAALSVAIDQITVPFLEFTGDVVLDGDVVTYHNVMPSNKGGAGDVKGILKANGLGTVTAAVSGVDYLIFESLSGKIDKPLASPSAYQVLTYNGSTSTWTPSAVSNIDVASTLTNYVPASSFTGTNQNKATSGYQKLPGGLIIQWGTLPTTQGNKQSAIKVFPIAFPTAVVSINCTAFTNSRPANVVNVWSVYSYTTTGFTARTQSTEAASYEGWWTAIGY